LLESELETMKNENAKLLEEMEKINKQKNQHLKELKDDYENSIKNYPYCIKNYE